MGEREWIRCGFGAFALQPRDDWKRVATGIRGVRACFGLRIGDRPHHEWRSHGAPCSNASQVQDGVAVSRVASDDRICVLHLWLHYLLLVPPAALAVGKQL